MRKGAEGASGRPAGARAAPAHPQREEEGAGVEGRQGAKGRVLARGGGGEVGLRGGNPSETVCWTAPSRRTASRTPGARRPAACGGVRARALALGPRPRCGACSSKNVRAHRLAQVVGAGGAAAIEEAQAPQDPLRTSSSARGSGRREQPRTSRRARRSSGFEDRLLIERLLIAHMKARLSGPKAQQGSQAVTSERGRTANARADMHVR